MKRYICIHCHFYQPLRENPWLEAVEVQDAASPYHDWNERITAECYAPNAASRILDEKQHIVKIVNNYERLSFNFGATLLDWLAEESPDTYASIIAADQASAAAFGGHGSAIAQAHSHMILPLATERDKTTQIVWGIRDFERRFRRKPEGMWLPETAVDTATLEALAGLGIRFTVLAPHQASAVRQVGSSEWEDVSGARIDPTVAYQVFLPSGRTIAVFFYDGPISRAVAFEGLLWSGEEFAGRLLSGFSDARLRPQLVHIATDGETYGHHHHHGDMALAYVLDVFDRDPSVEVTNYGQFLELHPPEHEVRIVENSSWSCVHGIDRWRSDCGCRTGGDPGWNQGWRGPLRDAFDWLRGQVDPLFEAAAGELLIDPWAARDDYIEVINDRSPANLQAFIRRHARYALDDEAGTSRVLQLLEMQRFAMLMYTSCGWFFSEVSGIETLQVLQYASRVVQLAAQIFGVALEEGLLARLEKAASNVHELQNGRVVYEKFVRPAMVTLAEVAAHYAVSSLFESYPETARIYCYEVSREDYHLLDAGRARIAIGRVRVTSRVTRESDEFSFGALYLGDLNVTGGVRQYRGEDAYKMLVEEMRVPFRDGDFPEIIRQLDRHFVRLTFSMKSLFRDEQRRILNHIWNSALIEAEASYRSLYERYRPLMRFHEDLFIPLPSVLRLTAEAAINLNLDRALARDELPVSQIESLLWEAKHSGVPLDETRLSYTFQNTFERIAAEFEEAPADGDLLARMETAAKLLETLPFAVNLWKVQNAYYRVLQRRAGSAQPEAWSSRFAEIGRKLSVSGAPPAREMKTHPVAPEV